MIEKINIEQFGSFYNYKWNKNMSCTFGELNIIYGRNYSGKTTLSRIFRSLEQRKLHSDFQDGQFSIELSGKRVLKQTEVDSSELKIRVYNYDFRMENLSFFYNKEEGQIIPFTILGKKNIETENKILMENENLNLVKSKLNGGATGTGLIQELELLEKDLIETENSLDSKLRHRAKTIKRESTLFRFGSKGDYTIKDIKKELHLAQSIPADKLDKFKAILEEKPKSPMEKLEYIPKKFNGFIERSDKLLRKSIIPTQTIPFLLENPDLQKWVREGIQHHKNKREKCAFCDSSLSTAIWEKLNNHFTKEAEVHKEAITALINELEEHEYKLTSKFSMSKEDFYVEYQDEYQNLINDLDDTKNNYVSDIDYISSQLKSRLNNIYNEYFIDDSKLSKSEELLNEYINMLNDIIVKNNNYDKNLIKKQDDAVKILRLDNIKSFMNEIRYIQEIDKIKKKRVLFDEKSEETRILKQDLQEVESRIKDLKASLNNELKAAEKINKYLKLSLGHPELALEVSEDNNKNVFVIKRSGYPAYNLSEGEQTLISFSYFLAKLEEISEEEKNQYAIFIDDPICSLDGSNIFSIYSLIDAEINQNKYKQVFISTHNMDFLKYLRKSSRKKKNYLMIQRRVTEKGKWYSVLTDMPKYMREYVTEFVFLFDQVYTVAYEEQNDDNYYTFYNFPNNARKFLESYLFFKYPDTKIKNDERINRFFNESSQVVFLQRINNEYSHGEEQFDRLSKPIDIPEFKKDARLIVETIKERDIEQYHALYNSIRK